MCIGIMKFNGVGIFDVSVIFGLIVWFVGCWIWILEIVIKIIVNINISFNVKFILEVWGC